jgi:hypothetical protein
LLLFNFFHFPSSHFSLHHLFTAHNMDTAYSAAKHTAIAVNLRMKLLEHSTLLAEAMRVLDVLGEDKDGVRYHAVYIEFTEALYHWKVGDQIIVVYTQETPPYQTMSDVWAPDGCLRGGLGRSLSCATCNAIRKCVQAVIL